MLSCIQFRGRLLPIVVYCLTAHYSVMLIERVTFKVYDTTRLAVNIYLTNLVLVSLCHRVYRNNASTFDVGMLRSLCTVALVPKGAKLEML